jgi:hypothetical protein
MNKKLYLEDLRSSFFIVSLLKSLLSPTEFKKYSILLDWNRKRKIESCLSTEAATQAELLEWNQHQLSLLHVIHAS